MEFMDESFLREVKAKEIEETIIFLGADKGLIKEYRQVITEITIDRIAKVKRGETI